MACTTGRLRFTRAGSRRRITHGTLDDSDLNDYAMETAAEDVLCTATIYNAWWSNEVEQGRGRLQGIGAAELGPGRGELQRFADGV